MIDLAVTLDPQGIAQTQSADLAVLHPAYVRWTQFLGLVSLRVGGREVLLPPNPRNFYRRPLPLLDIGPWALARVRSLAAHRALSYDCCREGWCLQLARSDTTVRLQGLYSGASAEAGYADLVTSWERFTADLRLRLKRDAPQLGANPFWGRWLDGADYEEIEPPRGSPSGDFDVIVDFEPDRAAMDHDRWHGLGDVRMAVLTYSCFEMPVRFRAGGVEFFALQLPHLPGVTATLPLLGFALDGLRVLRWTEQTGRGHYVLPESSPFLRFELAGEDVLVQYHPLPPVATVRFAALREAWERFARRVCAYLLERVPELGENPEWGPSLRELGLDGPDSEESGSI